MVVGRRADAAEAEDHVGRGEAAAQHRSQQLRIVTQILRP
jgi:hypothetical protein